MKTMELGAYLDAKLTPVSDELGGSNLAHILIAYIPASGKMRVMSDIPPRERAILLKDMAAALNSQAEALAKAPVPELMLPPSKLIT